MKNGVHETTEYLELFLRNLLLDEKNELHNRTDILPNMVAVFRIVLYYKSVTKYRRTRHTFTKSNGLYAMS